MGQHRVQRQILQNFSFPGTQPNSLETWYLKTDSYQPSKRSKNRVGFFDVECSESVDQYITKRENDFKDKLHRFSAGNISRGDVGRDLYDFIAMHYVRSQACSLQIRHLVDTCRDNSGLSQRQADSEYKRLTSRQDVKVFDKLVNSVSMVLTHYLVLPVMFTGPWSFLTSDKLMSASKAETDGRPTLVWFPVTPSIGFWLNSKGFGGQILGPVGVDRLTGIIEFVRIPEAQPLRFQAPMPEKGDPAFVAEVNRMMLKGSTELYSADLDAMKSALQTADQPTGYQYQPISTAAIHLKNRDSLSEE